MSENRILTDDPRLTAYALGELDAAEAAEIEKLLTESPAARAFVEETRELAGLLSNRLATEPALSLTDAQRAAILAAADRHEAHPMPVARPAPASQPAPTSQPGAPERRRARFASLLAAAAMIMVAVLIVPSGKSPEEPVAFERGSDMAEGLALTPAQDFFWHDGTVADSRKGQKFDDAGNLLFEGQLGAQESLGEANRGVLDQAPSDVKDAPQPRTWAAPTLETFSVAPANQPTGETLSSATAQPNVQSPVAADREAGFLGADQRAGAEKKTSFGNSTLPMAAPVAAAGQARKGLSANAEKAGAVLNQQSGLGRRAPPTKPASAPVAAGKPGPAGPAARSRAGNEKPKARAESLATPPVLTGPAAPLRDGGDKAQSEVEALIKSLRGEVEIESIPERGVILLKGSEADVARTKEAIRQLEQGRSPARAAWESDPYSGATAGAVFDSEAKPKSDASRAGNASGSKPANGPATGGGTSLFGGMAGGNRGGAGGFGGSLGDAGRGLQRQNGGGMPSGGAQPEPEFARKVQQFNEAIGQNRLEEAEVLAREARNLQPESSAAAAMYYRARLARQKAQNLAGESKAADALTQQLSDVEAASLSFVDPIAYGDAEKWKELSARKRRYGRENGRLRTEEEAEIDTKLSRPTSFHFQQAPLVDVFNDVAKQGQVNVVVDPAALQSNGLTVQSPVTLNVDGIRLKSALNLVLEPLNLDYVIVDGVVKISDKDTLNRSNIDQKAVLRAIETTVAELDELSKARDRAQLGLARLNELKEREERTKSQLEQLRRIADLAPGTEEYDPVVENQFVAPLSEPLSTFGVDVDTASYSNMRRFVADQRQLPPRNAVRIEEMVNYFAYDYPQPAANAPFSVNVEVNQAPWQPEHRLVRIGLKGRIPEKRPLSNLVFLVDVSGSMSSENKLPLVKAGLSMLAEQMTESDRVAIVTYSDTAALRLESTTGNNRKKILDTIASLQAGGSTNGADGIGLAYNTAVPNFIEGGTNRVILCTDGDFNVGVTGDDALVQLIQERARTKVFFSVFGFGMGNLKDGKLEKLADKGNGHYAYVDGQREAKKVFVDELAGTLITIAKDVKLQVEFNPARVGAYRLVGYENRKLAAQDFADDKKDAGDIGAGHTVTALYEIVPADRQPKPQAADGLRYQRLGLAREGEIGGELLTVKLRYKQPEGDVSALLEVPVADPQPAERRVAELKEEAGKPAGAPVASRPSRDFEWAAAVAAFGMVLRDSQFRGQAGLDLVLELAQGAKGDDKSGYRQEFIDLVQQVKSIRPDLAIAAGLSSPGVAVGGAALAADRPAAPVTPKETLERATVGGKYRNILRIVPAPADAATYGEFRDYGMYLGTSYLGHENLPQGYWVYVAPNWYIWGEAK